jgi:hypothetical protein
MSRTITASERSSLIRLAFSLPLGSSERRVILSGLKSGAQSSQDTRRNFLEKELAMLSIPRMQKYVEDQLERRKNIPSLRSKPDPFSLPEAAQILYTCEHHALQGKLAAGSDPYLNRNPAYIDWVKHGMKKGVSMASDKKLGKQLVNSWAESANIHVRV